MRSTATMDGRRREAEVGLAAEEDPSEAAATTKSARRTREVREEAVADEVEVRRRWSKSELKPSMSSLTRGNRRMVVRTMAQKVLATATA